MSHLTLYNNAFKQQIKLYNNYNTSDKRVFRLVDQYFNNTLNVSNLNDEITIIDENILSQNEKDIAFKLSRAKNNHYYAQLIEKFSTYRVLAQNYEKLLDKHDIYHKLTISENRQMDELMLKLIYSLIEIKVYLGMDLQDLSIKDINTYCECIAFDIINDTYEPLSINKHIYNREINIKTKR